MRSKFSNNSKQIFATITTLFILSSVFISTKLVMQNQDIREHAQTNVTPTPIPRIGCESITVAPSNASDPKKKKVFTVGEVVKIDVVGNSLAKAVKLYWSPSRHFLNGNPYNASINPPTEVALKSTAANGGKTTYHYEIIAPAQNGEFILMPRFYASSNTVNSIYCDSNPAFQCSDGSTACRTGKFVGAGISTNIACGGCHGEFAIDGTRELVATNVDNNTVFNMKDYLQISPGNYWLYQGKNNWCGDSDPNLDGRPADSLMYDCDLGRQTPAPTILPNSNYKYETFAARQTVEEKISIGGVQLYPMLMTKDKVEGYIYNNNARHYRKLITYFDETTGGDWTLNGSVAWGRPIGKVYTRPSTNPIRGVGTLLSTARSSDNESWTDFDAFYYPPQYLTKQIIKPSIISNNSTGELGFWGFRFSGIDRLYSETPATVQKGSLIYFNNLSTYSADRSVKNEVYYHKEKLSVIRTNWGHANHIYDGPTIRLRLFEKNAAGGWFIREDWYYAKGIGRVRVEVKDCGPRTNETKAIFGENQLDTDCNFDYDGSNPTPATNLPMKAPDLIMDLSAYYVVGSGPIVPTVNQTTYKIGSGSYNIKFVSPKVGSYNMANITNWYSGYLQVQMCKTAKVADNCTYGPVKTWTDSAGQPIWVFHTTGAVVNIPNEVNLVGFWRARFRPLVTRSTEAGETLVENDVKQNSIPWSNEVRWRVDPL